MGKKYLVVAIGLAALLAGVLFWLRRSHASRAPEVGDAAPDFVLPGLTQGDIRLRDYRHRVVVLNFWATWCPPCVEETPSLEKFASQARALGIAVIGVSVDQDRAALEKFIAEHRLSFPIARDPDQALASRYGTLKFPETYILDRDGKVAEKIIGAMDWQDPRIFNFIEKLARPASRAAP